MVSTGVTIPEITAALAAFVNNPEPYQVHSDPPLDLRALAAELELLPVMLDMGGCYGLKRDGEVVSFAWDEPHQLRIEREERIRNMAIFQGSLKYAVLAPLVPSRPPSAVTCSACKGTGEFSEFGERLVGKIICYCGGLGWLPGAMPTALGGHD
jgi:hypothetical protein